MIPKSETRTGNGDLARDVRKAKEATLRDVKETAGDLEQRLKATAHDAGERLQEFYTTNKERIYGARDNCERSIKERPFTATAIAFASGIILSRLLKR